MFFLYFLFFAVFCLPINNMFARRFYGNRVTYHMCMSNKHSDRLVKTMTFDDISMIGDA